VELITWVFSVADVLGRANVLLATSDSDAMIATGA